MENRFTGFPVARFQSIDNALVVAGRDGYPVREHINRLRPINVEQRFRARELKHSSVLPQPVEATGAQFDQAVFGQTGSAVGYRKEHQVAGSFRLPQHLLRDFIHRVFHYLASALRAIGPARAGPQKAHEIVDFGGGGYGGAGIACGVFLPDGNGGRNALNFIDFRFLHPLQKLPGVGGKRFDVAALALGIHRIEGQRRLTGSGYSGNHGQFVQGERKRDVPQIVHPRTTDHHFRRCWICFH